MSDASPGARRSSRGLWLLIYLLLLPAAVVPLLVPLYDKTDPTLLGFPFYYWFQFALIPCAAVLTLTAYLVSKVADERDRGER
ncbi:DUF3311 domain-containing protein [Nocardioides sp.]|jgi:hypothetical protein|uniref:DUF3311 domain-containing protein n=1 Tax=Nocardioides sp. TaxID=35761 RepID=UPI0031FEB4D1|nr:hypothetical protein [Nocardioides sp.]